MCFDIRVVTCGPNEALIISGVFYGREPAMIVGGRALVIPCIQTIQKLPLSTITLVVNSPKVYTSQGVPISVTGVAQVNSKICPFWARDSWNLNGDSYPVFRSKLMDRMVRCLKPLLSNLVTNLRTKSHSVRAFKKLVKLCLQFDNYFWQISTHEKKLQLVNFTFRN